MRIKAYPRDERKSQIMAIMAIEVQHGRIPKLTMYQIAKRLDMSPSSHLMKILKEMDEERLLDSWWVEHRSNKLKMIFTLPPNTYELPYR